MVTRTRPHIGLSVLGQKKIFKKKSVGAGFEPTTLRFEPVWGDFWSFLTVQNTKQKVTHFDRILPSHRLWDPESENSVWRRNEVVDGSVSSESCPKHVPERVWSFFCGSKKSQKKVTRPRIEPWCVGSKPHVVNLWELFWSQNSLIQRLKWPTRCPRALEPHKRPTPTQAHQHTPKTTATTKQRPETHKNEIFSLTSKTCAE
jgi:hypothetical protein